MATIVCIWGSSMSDIVFTDSASLGQAIRDARKALKFTQEDLALQTGISRATIRAIEHGKETAQVGLVLQLCRDLGMSLRATAPGKEGL